MTDNEFLNPFDQFDQREETDTPPIPGAAPPPLAPEALKPGQMSVPFDADPTIAGAQAQDHANKSAARDDAREASSASILSNWNTLDDAAREEWVKGERAAGQSQADWWQGARDYVLDPLLNVNKAFKKLVSGDETYDGKDGVTGWLDRKTSEMVALGKRRQFLADEIEAGRAEAAKISATRNTAEQTGKGFGEGLGNILAGTGRGVNYATDAILEAMGAPRDMTKPDQRYFGNALQDVGNWISHKAEEFFPGDEARQNEFSGKLGQGVGSMAAFMGPSLTISLLTKAGPKTITALSGGLGAPMQAESMAQDAEAARDKGVLKADGTPVTDDDVRNAYLIGLPIGATEAAPIAHLLQPLGASSLVRAALVQAAEEGGQEWVQSVLENVTAQQLYDPDRRWDDGAWESAAIGAILGSGMEVANHARERVKEARLRSKGTTTDVEPSAAPAPDAAASPEIAATPAVPAEGTKPPREPQKPLENALPWPEDENIDDLEAVPGMTAGAPPETDLRSSSDPVLDDLNSSFEALLGKQGGESTADETQTPPSDASDSYVDRLSKALTAPAVAQEAEPEAWGPKFQGAISREYDAAVAGEDLSTQYDILKSKYNNDLNATPENRAALRTEVNRLVDEMGPESAKAIGAAKIAEANPQENRANARQAPGKVPEKIAATANTESAPTPAMKAAFREVLRGDKPSKSWAKAVGATPEQMKALIKDAKRQKLIRKAPGGAIRRTALAKEVAPETAATPPLADSKPVKGTKKPVQSANPADIPGTPENLAVREVKARAEMESPEALGATLTGGIQTDKQPGYMTPEWKANREYVAKDGSIIKGYDAAVAHLAAELEAKIPGGLRFEKQAAIVIGFPGAGKGTVSTAISAFKGAAHVTCDDAKEMIPEYDNGFNSSGVHEESTVIAADVVETFMNRGANFIFEKVGSSDSSIARPLAMFREQGYHTDLVYVDVPKAIAMERALSRFRRMGRLTALSYYDLNISDVYNILKQEGAADETTKVDWRDTNPAGWYTVEAGNSLAGLTVGNRAPGKPSGALREPAVGGPRGEQSARTDVGASQGQGGNALTISPEQRVDRVIRQREDATGKIWPEFMVQFATRLEVARGTKKFNPILAEVKADKRITKALALELAHAVGVPPKSATTKAQALKSIADRHKDLVKVLASAAQEQADADSRRVEQSAGDVSQTGVPEGRSSVGSDGLSGATPGSDRAGSGRDVPGLDASDGNVGRDAGGAVRGPAESAPGNTGEGARNRDTRANQRAAAERAKAVAESIEADREAEREARADRARANYDITPDDKIGQGGAKAKVKGNLEALRTLAQIEAEGRTATDAEKKILVKYVGWGAFAQDVFATHKPEWAKERAQLADLLTPDEYKAARASVLNAHYTSEDVINGVWGALEHLGFKGGRALEPSAGIGHFIGLAPKNLKRTTDWTAVELDTVSGRITKALYGAADVRIQGFETTDWPDGFFDLAVSNVPFGAFNLEDKERKGYLIHDYFFIKSLAKVRPGGVVAFITSKGTLDKVGASARKAIAKQATFLGAIRLPGGSKGAFKSNAGTDVTTDIVFLRRRVDGEPIGDQSWLELKDIKTPDGVTQINSYFADNPDMMLGKMRLQGTMHRADEPVLIGSSEGLGEKIIAAAKAGLPENAMLARGTASKDIVADVDSNPLGKPGGLYQKGGKTYRIENGVGVEQKVNAAEARKIAQFIGMRDAVNALLDGQSTEDFDGTALRERLNAQYDAFLAEHGPINKVVTTTQVRKSRDLLEPDKEITIRRYPNMSAFEDDPDSYKVRAIEVYDPKTDAVRKAAILTQDILAPYERPAITGGADALAVSLNETGKVDIPLIAQALEMTEAQAIKALGDKIYLDPKGDEWTPAEQYLAGDVVQKLEDARAAAAADSKYRRNVDALEKAQPAPLTRLDIRVNMGAPWIPVDVYQEFIREVLGPRNLDISINAATQKWTFGRQVGAYAFPPSAQAAFGTDRVDVKDILEAALNSTQINVWDKGPDETRVRNPAAEAEAQARVTALRDRFNGNPRAGVDSWLWENDARAERLEPLYNYQFNRLAPETYDGSHLTFPGLARVVTYPDGGTGTINLTKHRTSAVWRIIRGGNTLLGHVVGSGKTWTMIMSGMEQKRLGLIQRPMYVVPNHMLEQFSNEFLQAYPNAKLLVASKDEMSAKTRKAFVARAAADKWDGIIITHDAFGRISMSDEAYKEFYTEQIEEIERIIADQKKEDGDRAPTVKDSERRKKSLKNKLDKLLNKERKDDGTTFEQMGVDFLYVDEAHLFKNLSFFTQHNRIKGISNSSESQRATDLFVKIRQLEKSRPGRSAVFATGTPVSNTMAELYTMQRYLQNDELKKYGIEAFDAWAHTFGQMHQEIERTVDGKMKAVTSFSKFINIPELMSIFSRVADVQTADMLNLPRPKLEGGRVGVVEAEANEEERAYMQSLVERADRLKREKVDPEEDNMLKIVSEGRKVATDMRLLDQSAPFNENGKIGKAVNKIYDIWKDGADPALVQMVFLDMGVPGSKGGAKPTKLGKTKGGDIVAPDANIERIRKQLAAEAKGEEIAEEAEADQESDDFFAGLFNLYEELRNRLVMKGIPKEQIAFIHEAKGDDGKERMFEDVRNGKIRVFVGSTGKMGVGTNVQKRLKALHHIDAPWKPAEVEQRDGRILRQGNKNDEIAIYRYVTRNSFDAYMWQILERKAKFIGQLLAGSRGARDMEDIDNPLPEAAALKAAASGDPRILEHATLTKELADLDMAKRAHMRAAQTAKASIAVTERQIASTKDWLRQYSEDAAKVQDLSGENFKVALETGREIKTFVERKAAGEAVRDYVVAAAGNMWGGGERTVDLGEMSNFAMSMAVKRTSEGIEVRAILNGATEYRSNDPFLISGESNPVGVMLRFERILKQIPGLKAATELALQKAEADLPRLRKAAEVTAFPKQAEIDRATARREALESAVNDTAAPAATSERQIAEGKISPADFAKGVADLKAQLGVKTIEMPDAPAGDELPSLIGVGKEIGRQLAMVGQKGSRVNAVRESLGSLQAHTTSIVSVAKRTADVDIDQAPVAELRTYQKALNDLSQIVTAELDAAYEIKDNLDTLAEKATDSFDTIWTELGNISHEARELMDRINESIEGIDDVFPDLYAEDEDSDTGTDLTIPTSVEAPVYPEGYTLLDVIAEETGGDRGKLQEIANRVDEIINSFDDLEITEDEARAIADKLYAASDELAPLIWNTEFWGDIANNRMTEAADLINGMIENSVIPAIDTLEETAGEVSDKLDEVTDLIDEQDDALPALVGYHGSPNNFTKFSSDFTGSGVDASNIAAGRDATRGKGVYISLSQDKGKLYADWAKDNKGQGYLYQVSVDVDFDELLRDGTPLSQQGAVGAKVAKAVVAASEAAGRPIDLNSALAMRRLESVMMELARGAWARAGKQEGYYKTVASDEISKLGVAGLAYAERFDNMAPHWDTVIFDPARIEITHKDGKPVTVQEREDVLASMVGGQQSAPSQQEATATLTPRAAQMAPEIIAQIEAELRQALPSDIAVRMADRLFFHGTEAAGLTSMSKKLVQIGLGFGQGVAQETARHEAIHVLREYQGFGILSGLYSDEEWATLVARAKKIKAGRDIRIVGDDGSSAPGVFMYRDIYEQRGRADELVNQELVAKMAETWVDGARYGTAIDKLIYRAFEFFDAIARALKSLGFNVATDVFGTESDAVLRDTFGGEIAARANEIENDPFRSDTLAAKIQTYHGTPNDWAPEKLVRLPDGSEQYVPFDAVPPGARVIKALPAGRPRFDKTRPGAHQAFGPGFYSAENINTAESYEPGVTSAPRAIIKLDGKPADEPAGKDRLADTIAKRDALRPREREYFDFAREIDGIITPAGSSRKIRATDGSLTADLKTYVKKYTHRKMYYPNAPKYGGGSLQLEAARWLENFPSREAAIKGIDKSIAGIKAGMEGKSRSDQAYAHTIIRDYYRKQAILENGTEEKGVLWDDMISKAAALEKDFRAYVKLEKKVRELETKKGNRFKSEWLHEDGVEELAYYKSLDEMRQAMSTGAKYQPALDAVEELQQLMDAGRLTWEPIDTPKTGGIYHLTLHVDDDQLIDWDQPISKQPKSVQDGLRKLYPGLVKSKSWFSPSQWFSALFGGRANETMPSDVIRKEKDQEKLRQALIAAGIPGIRFFDGFSRKHQKGTHNYVIFNPDDHVEVTHKDGKPVTDIEREMVLGMSQDKYAKGKDQELAALIGAPSRDTLRTEIEEMLRHDGFDKNGTSADRDGGNDQDQAVGAGNAGTASGTEGSARRRRKIQPDLRTKALTGLIGDYYSTEAIDARRISQGFTTKGYHATTVPLFDTPDPFVTNKDFGFHASLDSPAGANDRIGYGDRQLSLSDKVKGIFDKLFGDGAAQEAETPEGGKVIPIWINAGKSLEVPDIILADFGEINGWAQPYAWLDLLSNHAGGNLALSELKLWVRNWIKDRRESGRLNMDLVREASIASDADPESILSVMLAHDFSRDLGAKLESMGYNSVTYTNEVEAPGTKSIFVWDSARVRSKVDLFHESAVGKPGFEASADVVLSDARKALNELADELGFGDDVFASIAHELAPLPGNAEAGLADLAGKLEGTTKVDTRSGAQPGAVTALSAIIADLKSALGMPTTQGRYGLTVYDGSTGAENNRAPRAWRFRPQDNLRGQYHRRTGAARYKLSTDIEAIAHEGGHHLESLLGNGLDQVKRAHADELRSYAHRSYTPAATESPYATAAFSPQGFSGLELDAESQRLAVEWKAADAAWVAAGAQTTGDEKAKVDRYRAELQYRIGEKTADKVLGDIHAHAARNRVQMSDLPAYVRSRFSATGVPKPAKVDPRASLSEGFAEFFREYLLNPNDAALYAPEFKAAFEDLLDARAPALLQKIERAQLITTSKAYDDYLKATTLDRAKADLVTEADQSWSSWAKQTEVLKGIGQAETISGAAYRIFSNMMDVASGAAGQVYTMLVDENHPWYLGTKRLLDQSDQNQRVDDQGRAVSLAVHENPYKLVRSLGDSFKTGLRWIQDGVPNYQQRGGPRSASLHSALSLVMGNKWNIDAYQTFGVYLESRRAVEEWKTWTAKRRAMADTSYQITVATAQNKALRDALASEQAKTERRNRAGTGNDAVIRDYDRIIQGLITQEANEVRDLQEGQVATPGMTKQQERNARIRLADIREKINAYEERRKDLVVRRNRIGNDRALLEARTAQYESEIAKREAIIERGRARLKDMRENGIQRDPHRVKQSEHEARIAEIEASLPNVQQAATLVYDFVWQSAIHDFQAGRLTKAELDYRAPRRHFYVPFARDLSDMIAERGFGGRSAAAKKFAKDKAFAGSDRAIVNPLETIIDQTFHRAAATHFNGVMKAFVALADSVGSGGAAVAERVTQSEILDPDSDGFKQIVNRLMSMGYSQDDAKEMVKRIESDFGDTQLLLQWSPEGHGANKPLLLPLWEDGERKLIRLNDPEWANLVYNSVNGIGRDMTDIFTNLLSKPATLLRTGVTTNPAFVLPNIIRDMWSAWILTGSMLDPRTWPGITQARGLYHEFAQTEAARAYQEVAGIMGGQNVAALSKVRDKADVMALKSRGLHIKPFRLTAASAIGAAAGFSMAGPAGSAFGAVLGAGLHNGVTNFWETLAHFSDMSETATRLGVFTQAYKEALAYNPALTPFQASQEAAYVARDLIDFGRRGSRMLAASRLVPFLNANVQGLDKAVRAFLARGDRGTGLGASKIGAVGALGAGAGYLAGGAILGSAAAFAAPAAAVALASRSDAARRLLAPYSKQQFGLPVSAEEEKVMGDSAKAWANLLLYTLILASFAALYHDDDEYRMIGDRVKHRGQPVKLGGEWYQVPKAFEFAIPANIIEAGINLSLDKDPRFWERVRESLAENISPPMLPQSARLWSDIRSNYNSLSGRQIVPEYQKALPPQEQFNAYTSQMAIAVSRAINESKWGKPTAEAIGGALFANPNFEISPAILDYALSTGGGYWGKDVQKASNLAADRDLGPKTGRLAEYPIVGTVLQRLSVDPARASEALQTYYEEMSPVAQGYPRAAAGYDTVLKNRGQQAANTVLATYDEDHRAYALLMGSSDTNNKRLHPLNRLQDVIGSITSMEQDLAYGRLADTSEKTNPQPILLAPAQAAEMRDTLAKIKAIEANNTFVALGKDQFASRNMIDVQPALDVLKAISPEAATELQLRYDRKHVTEFQQAVDTWPAIKDELLETWNALAPTGESMPNPKKRRSETKPYMMRLGGPVPARPADLPRLDDDPAAGIGYPTDAQDDHAKFDEGIVLHTPQSAPSNMREIDARKTPQQPPQNDVDDLRWQEKMM